MKLTRTQKDVLLYLQNDGRLEQWFPGVSATHAMYTDLYTRNMYSVRCNRRTVEVLLREGCIQERGQSKQGGGRTVVYELTDLGREIARKEQGE